jgi:hypothetical protein
MTSPCQMLTSPATRKVCTKQDPTPTGAMEALTGLSPLDLVIWEESMSAANHLWSLG